LKAHEEIQRLQKGLLSVITIPIPHVIVVRTVGPICHHYPFDEAICLENHILHLQLGLVTTDFLQEEKEGRDYRVGGMELGLLWHSNERRDGRTI